MNRSARTWRARARVWVGAGQRRGGRIPMEVAARAHQPTYAPAPPHTTHAPHTPTVQPLGALPPRGRPPRRSATRCCWGSRRLAAARRRRGARLPSCWVVRDVCVFCVRALLLCGALPGTHNTHPTDPPPPIADDGITRRPQPAAVPIRKSVAGGSWGVGGKDHLSMDGPCTGAEGQPRWRASTLSHSHPHTQHNDLQAAH